MIRQASIGDKIRQGVISSVGLTVISIAAALIQFRFVVDYLPKDMAGLWFIFLNVAAYISFFDLGISPTLSREISFVSGKGVDQETKWKEISNLVSTSLRIYQIIAIIVFLVSLLIGSWFLKRIPLIGVIQDIQVAWIVFCTGASLNLLSGNSISTLFGLGDVAIERLIRSSTQIIGVVLSSVSLYLGFGIVGLSVAWMIQGVSARIIGWIILYRRYPRLRQEKGRASLLIAKKISLPSLKWAITGLGTIIILQTDNLIIAGSLGPSMVPNYEAAAKIVTTLGSLAILIISSTTPFLSKAYAEDNITVFKDILMKNLQLCMSIIVICVSFLAVFGEKVVDVWLGAGNFVGFPVLWTLLLMITLEVHHVIHAAAVMSTGKIEFYWLAILSGILNLFFSLFLVKELGLWGVALGTLCSQIITNNWYAPYLSIKRFKISFAIYIKKVVFPIFILFVLLLILNILSLRFLSDTFSDFINVIFAFGITVISGGLLALVLLMPKSRRPFLEKLTRTKES